MAGKISLLVGFGAGYVLGARSGRERYEQIAGKAQEVWRDPRVQEKAGQAQRLVKGKASEAGSKVSEKVNKKSGSEDSWTQAGTNGASTTTASSTARTPSGSSDGTTS
jgi:hypothetical protein